MVKGVVIYYSQAGSTQKIAQAIHKGMSQRLEQCDIARLKEIQPKDLENYDLIGLGSPVWKGGPTVNTKNFIEELPSLEGKHGFYFCTHGTSCAQAVPKAVAALRGKGLTVVGWEDWYGSVFIPCMAKPYYTDGHPDAIDLKEAEKFGIEMAERSQRISQGATELIPTHYLKDYGEGAIMHKREDYLEAASRPFKINEEKCTRCMLCADNCPMNNIDFSVSPPIFKTTDCARCWYCWEICPEGAIEYDFEDCYIAVRDYTQSHHKKNLAADEAKGYFRRLVPLEKVGWDTPWYKISKPPRLTIP